MKKSGITLIALTITVLVLIILTSTSIYFGMRAVNRNNNFNIYSNLSMIYPKIEDIYDKYSFNPEGTELPGYELTNDMRIQLEGLGINSDSGLWRFLTKESLDELLLPQKVKEPNTNLFVNYDDLEIVYTKGYKRQDGTFTYRYSEMKELEKNKYE